MYPPAVKTGVFALEGLHALAVTYFFTYLYFFMQARFGFGAAQNLWLAAFAGLIYTLSAVYGGRFGQRRGYFTALRLGFLLMGGAMAVGSGLENLAGQWLVVGTFAYGMSFTWPNLEAMVSERESPARLQRMIGIYNLVWAGSGALAFFSGGAILETFGLRSLFLVPMGILFAQLALTLWLERLSLQPFQAPVEETPPRLHELPLNPRPVARAKTFLRLGWTANPFAFIAISTLIPIIPTLALRFELTPKWAGFLCSIWLFARAGAFGFLWWWPGWHYQFRWLIGAYVAMASAFLLILVVPRFEVLIGGQIVFGFALGLIYYSSLFYSMDVGETKGEHGGVHEAAIGSGTLIGPLLGALALYWFPGQPDSGAWAVGGLLVCGAFLLLGVRAQRQS